MKILPLKLLLSLFLITHILEAQQFINQRQIVLLEKIKRPDDLWPRGDGHVVLGEPGSPLSQKGYYEPGGSFSPSPGSFGLSIWVYDRAMNIIATSDNIPMDNIQQEYVYDNASGIPSIKTITPYYTCSWKFSDYGKWELSITNADSNAHILAIVTRSVGPAGGPLTSGLWDSTKLMINHRWLVTASAKPSSIIIGDEEAGELLKNIPFRESVVSENGWAFSKMVMDNNNFTIIIKDTRPQYKGLLSYGKTVQQFDIELPDKRFVQSLQAQVSNLMMGYIGKQTGPGEPVNYPLAWERDGAYSLAAMAKSGNLQTARELSIYFAENDFFGGFGAEGDAPGSAINALTEVAFLLNDSAYYKWVWPHIKRKLAIIDEMMNADHDIYKNYIGPLVPYLEKDLRRRQLICRKTEDGLITGTMDLHFPVLYINAISYRGLIQASRLAALFKDNGMVKACLEKAAKIKAAWFNGFGKEEYDNERNFMISIWPSWITNKDYPLFQQKIEARHEADWGDSSSPKERPLWTYFTVAEAHQWLFMDHPENTWKTLHYFWNNQCSPGLYTYWEGNGEENSFRQWENYRGWIKPKYVTPHYWTASEMALLQLDMLVYIDESKDDYQFVIGAGIPAEWLKENMSVKNYRTKAGIVSWEYKKNVLNVTINGALKKYSVRPGISFKQANTKLNIVYK